MNETKTRSLIKTITWRIVATLVTLSAVYFFTEEIDSSVKITLTAAVLSMVVYYIHERAWNMRDWGRK